ncbi:MAG: hypothetical protein IKA77_01145 [Clostridia bacterium]|nr:hypothetical protein [Clostridia bacterium]
MAGFKAPEHNSLDGQVIEYGGKKFRLSASQGMTAPIQMPLPKFKLNPTMSFGADENGQLQLRIKPNPEAIGFDYSDWYKK